MQQSNVASYYRPPSLASQTALTIAKCLIYEDSKECTHYRWDPVVIWQYELPQRKKKSKKSSERSHLFVINDVAMPMPQPPWKDIKKFRDWWWNVSPLGTLSSNIRCHIVDAFEQLSWTANTEEEYVLFLLLRLCVELSIELGGENFDIPSEWCSELSQVITQLGPFSLQKLCVSQDALGLKPVLTSLIQQSPYLQVLKVNQWAVSNDVMAALGSNCRMLTEFAIPCMQPQVFMSDESLFSCFFDGMSREEVFRCWSLKKEPNLSFSHLRFLDILYCKQTEKFLQMISVFYPKVRLCGIGFTTENEELNLAKPFLDIGAQMTAQSVSCRTRNILSGELKCLINTSSFLRELRIHIDDNFEGADNDSIYEKQIEEAGIKLKDIVCQMTCFDSLSIRPHDGVDVTNVLLPVLHTQGSLITSLHICYEYAPVNTNVLYQILNLCPKLCRLAISLRFGESDEASACKRTALQPVSCLHTLVMQDISLEMEMAEDSVFTRILDDLLTAAPNIEVLGFSCAVEMQEDLTSVASASVKTLHLQFCFELDSLSALQFFMCRLLPNFPSLRALSIEIRDGDFQFESVNSICKTGIKVTRRKPEFFQIPNWDISSSQNTFAILVM